MELVFTISETVSVSMIRGSSSHDGTDCILVGMNNNNPRTAVDQLNDKLLIPVDES
jgi:hypothetical protein